LTGLKPIKQVTSEPTYLEVKKSKFKVTGPINAHTVNAQYLPKGKVYELQTCYRDGALRPASPTSALTSNGRKVQEISKLVGRLHTPYAIKHTSFKVKRSFLKRVV